MEVLYPRCCGVDVHKKTVVVCSLLTQPNGRVEKEIRSYGTMTDDLLGLMDWLAALGCTHVAMESTGVYTPPTIVLRTALSSKRWYDALTYRPAVSRGLPVRRFRSSGCRHLQRSRRHEQGGDARRNVPAGPARRSRR